MSKLRDATPLADKRIHSSIPLGEIVIWLMAMCVVGWLVLQVVG